MNYSALITHFCIESSMNCNKRLDVVKKLQMSFEVLDYIFKARDVLKLQQFITENKINAITTVMVKINCDPSKMLLVFLCIANYNN